MTRKFSAEDVSDHALVRWLERVHGVDMEWFRAALANDIARLVALDNQLINRDGVTYLIRGGRLVSVTPGKTAQRRTLL